MKTNMLSFLFNQKFVHVVVIILTFILVFVNLGIRTRVDASSDLTSKTRETLLSSLVQSEFGDFEEEEELIVEGVEDIITGNTKTSYMDEFASMKMQQRVKMDIPEENVEPVIENKVVQNDSSGVTAGVVSSGILQKPRTKTISYTIKTGDTISTIAEEFGISVNTILWANNLSSYSVIRPGDTLDILPITGVSHKVASGENLSYIAQKYDVEMTEIAQVNRMSLSSTLALGQELIIPDGKIVNTTVASKPKTYSGYTAIKEIVKAPNATPVAGNKMQWPTKGHIITQYFNWRHYGLDIANKTGTPLYAADAGTVVDARWGNGYGNFVKIDHGGGKYTLYAHASKLFVKKGDKVKKGETLAAMGSTGWSTGPHIHFEVIINGKKYNPLDYIK